jgi:hypothetical protein
MTILMPFPGTQVFNKYVKTCNWDLSVCDEYSNPYWRTKVFSNDDLKAIQRNFMDKFKDRLCYRLRKKN